jgi:hypothetical protein
MEFAALGVLLLYFAAVVMVVFWPLWAFWLAHRAVRHLGGIELALYQIHAALVQRNVQDDPVQLAQRAQPPVDGHVVNSMFGR